MQAEIDESAEVHDVFDFSGNFHARLQIFELNDAFLHDRSGIVVARIAVRLFQFFCDIRNRRFPDAVFFFEFLFQFAGNFAARFDDGKKLARRFVVFGMHPRVVERLSAFGNF